jgi:hypothetical protein
MLSFFFHGVYSYQNAEGFDNIELLMNKKIDKGDERRH